MTSATRSGAASSAEPAEAANEVQRDGGREEPSTGRGGWRPTEGFWPWLRLTARLWGFLAFVILILVLFRGVILPFVLGLIVTYVLAPVLRYLTELRIRGRTLPRFIWLIALYIVLLGLMAVFFTSFVPRLAHDLKRVMGEVPRVAQTVQRLWLPRLDTWVERNFGDPGVAQPAPGAMASGTPAKEAVGQAAGQPAATLPPSLSVRQGRDGAFEITPNGLELELIRKADDHWVIRAPAPRELADSDREVRFDGAVQRYVRDMLAKSETKLGEVFRLGQHFVLSLLQAVTTFILVLMISAFLLMDTERILSWLRNLVPSSHHGDFQRIVTLVDRGLSGVIRGQLLICLVNGVLTGVGLLLIGVKYPLLLALLAGVMSLIPIFGSILSTIPIVVVALVSGNSGVDVIRGLMVLAWIIGIHLLEANLLNPKIIGTTAKIHPVIVVFAVVAGERTYGVIGALLAVPIVSAVQVMFLYIRAKVQGEAATSGAAEGARS